MPITEHESTSSGGGVMKGNKIEFWSQVDHILILPLKIKLGASYYFKVLGLLFTHL